MSALAPQIRKHLAALGALIMVAGFGLMMGNIDPTEASWSDQAHGKSTFGITNTNAGKNFARSFSAYGTTKPLTWLSSDGILAGNLLTVRNTTGLAAADIPGIRRTASAGIVNSSTTSNACARSIREIPTECTPSPTPAAPKPDSPQSYATSTFTNLDIKTLLTPRVAFGSGESPQYAPITATAACMPGTNGSAALQATAPIMLGDNTSWFGDNRTPLPMPTGATPTTAEHVGSLYRIAGTLRREIIVSPGYSRAQLRLDVTATSRTTGAEGWSAHILLVHAECGASVPETNAPARPDSSNMMMTTQLMSARTMQAPTTTIVSPAATPPDTVPDQPTTSATATSAPATSEPATPSAGTSTSTTTNVSTAPTSAPTPEESSAPGIAPTEDATAEPTEQSAAAEGPQQPESVRAGREFTVVNRDGVELGRAKVEDIVRTPGCGVELTLSITTSAEPSPDRWASVGPDDFAEVRAGGATRGATRLSSDCEHAADSRTTTLSPGRDYEIVIAFQLDDSAQRAMLQPDGTPGWIFDLPPLPRVTATTSPQAAPPAADESPSTSAASEEPQAATTEA